MEITDEMVEVYFETHRKFVFDAVNMFPRHIGPSRANVTKEACRAGLTAAFELYQTQVRELPQQSTLLGDN